MKAIDSKLQLCEVGDKLYRITKIYKSNEFYIEPILITLANFTGGTFGHWYYRDNKGRSYFNSNLHKRCFKTEEEAKQEIQNIKNIAKKRELLKKYEKEVNKKLNIENHYIIK